VTTFTPTTTTQPQYRAKRIACRLSPSTGHITEEHARLSLYLVPQNTHGKLAPGSIAIFCQLSGTSSAPAAQASFSSATVLGVSKASLPQLYTQEKRTQLTLYLGSSLPDLDIEFQKHSLMFLSWKPIMDTISSCKTQSRKTR
jgi:hypothetical protein